MNKTQTYPLYYGLKNTQLPLIVVSIRDHYICLLLDTGATINLLDENVSKYFNNELEASDSGFIQGLDGNKQNTSRTKLTFNFEGNPYTTIFNLFDSSAAFGVIEKESDIQIHGILGNEFFIENEWVLDFEKLQLQFKT